MKVHILKNIKAHGSELSDDLGEIQQLISWKDKLISLGLDGLIKIWSHDLEILKQLPINEYYQISLAVNGEHIIIGNGNGELLIYNSDYTLKQTIKICNEIISDIKVFGKNILVTAFDGIIAKLDSENYKILQKIDTKSHIDNICYYKGDYFVAGVKSFKVNEQLSTFSEIQRANKFIADENCLYSLTDEKGFVNQSEFIATNEPCDIACLSGNEIVGVTDSTLTVFQRTDSGITWKTSKIDAFKSGYTPRAIVSIGNREVIVGNDRGLLTKLMYQDL